MDDWNHFVIWEKQADDSDLGLAMLSKHSLADIFWAALLLMDPNRKIKMTYRKLIMAKNY